MKGPCAHSDVTFVYIFINFEADFLCRIFHNVWSKYFELKVRKIVRNVTNTRVYYKRDCCLVFSCLKAFYMCVMKMFEVHLL
jgi:hypothetical protein